MKSLIKISTIFFLVASLSVLEGCSTVRGFGQDVSQTGHAIQKL